MSIVDRPLVAPDRKTFGFRPLKVLKHFRRLLADKEDTEQVFHIIEALKGRKSHQQAWEFINSPNGERLMQEQTDLAAMLDDHNRWADCGPKSVAQHYIEFMKREGLTAAGLVAESHKWLPLEKRPLDKTEWYFERLRDTHDLFHVLTGYNRDGLGELCLLGFSYEQNHNLGILFIAYAGARNGLKEINTKAPFMDAIREGRFLGKLAQKIAHQDIEALMHEDISDARRRLNIGKPVKYRECIEILFEEGLHDEQMIRAEKLAA